MNFSNMPELGVEEYPYFPGVYLLWFVLVVIYGSLFVVGFHYRIFHAAL